MPPPDPLESTGPPAPGSSTERCDAERGPRVALEHSETKPTTAPWYTPKVKLTCTKG